MHLSARHASEPERPFGRDGHSLSQSDGETRADEERERGSKTNRVFTDTVIRLDGWLHPDRNIASAVLLSLVILQGHDEKSDR